jgi:transposase InsO family protein
VAESFFGTLKREYVKGWGCPNSKAARASSGAYIHGFYKAQPRHRHQHLGQASPIEFGHQQRDANRKAE